MDMEFFDSVWKTLKENRISCHEADDLLVRRIADLTRQEEGEGLIVDTRYLHSAWEMAYGRTPKIIASQAKALIYIMAGLTWESEQQRPFEGERRRTWQ